MPAVEVSAAQDFEAHLMKVNRVSVAAHIVDPPGLGVVKPRGFSDGGVPWDLDGVPGVSNNAEAGVEKGHLARRVRRRRSERRTVRKCSGDNACVASRRERLVNPD